MLVKGATGFHVRSAEHMHRNISPHSYNGYGMILTWLLGLVILFKLYFLIDQHEICTHIPEGCSIGTEFYNCPDTNDVPLEKKG